MIKRTLCILTILWLMVSLVANAQPVKMIKTKVPKRPAGQTDVLQLTAPPMETVRVEPDQRFQICLLIMKNA